MAELLMPNLDTNMHLDMLRTAKAKRRLHSRAKQTLHILFRGSGVYGLEWGDPNIIPPLSYVRDHFILPYLTKDTIAFEIDPGGGRWTRYMLGVRRLYAVDYHEELLLELRSSYGNKNIVFVKNNGNDFPGISKQSIGFIFSFGTFVHLDVEIIQKYLMNIRTLLKPGANVIIQYADKSKPLSKMNEGFSHNCPDIMRQIFASCGYFTYEEDVKTLWHSSLVQFGIRE